MSTPSLEEFEALNPSKLQPCKVGVVRDLLADEDRDKLDAALEAPKTRISNAAIIKWVEQRGHTPPSVTSVTAHRKRTCTCTKATS